MQQKPSWMNILPVDAARLNLDQLRNFKHFYQYINTQDMCAPANVQRAYRAFRSLYFYACILITEKKFPALNKCWDDLRGRYSKLPIFDDAVFIESWIFLDFPITSDGQTVLDEFDRFLTTAPEALEEFGPFTDAARASRFGLYQEMISTSRITKFRELFTGTTLSTLRSVPDYSPGEIFLGRIIEYGGDRFLFGDPKNFPGSRRDALIDMVSRRLPVIRGSDTIEQYERFMKLAGPYWMSVVGGGEDGEILPPDYWQYHHRQDAPAPPSLREEKPV